MADKTAREMREERWRSRLDPTYKPRREPITLERIVDTAFAIMEKDGYEALSMRRIAKELGTGAASLYAHVENKAELDLVILDQLSRDFVPPEPDPARWREQLKDQLRAMRTAMNAHPGVARAVIGIVPTGSETMRGADGMLALLLAGGVHPQVAAWSLDLLALYVSAVSFEESVQLRAGDGRPLAEQEAEYVDQLREYFTSLPADRFPHLAAHALVMTTGSGEDRFEFGLDVIVAGIEIVSNQWHERDGRADDTNGTR